MTKANSVTDVVNDGNKWKVEAINADVNVINSSLQV